MKAKVYNPALKNENMNREEYISKLEGQSERCECPELGALFEIERVAQEQADGCDFLRNNVDMKDLRPENKTYLLNYAKRARELRVSVARHTISVRKMIDEGRLRLMLHNLQTFAPEGPISRDSYQEIPNREGRYVATIHCAKCETQIAVAE